MLGNLLLRQASLDKLRDYTLANAAVFLLWSTLPLIAGWALLHQHVIASLRFGVTYGLPSEQAAAVLLGKAVLILAAALCFVELLGGVIMWIINHATTARGVLIAYLVTLPAALATFLIPLAASNLGKIAASAGSIAALGWSLALLSLANAKTQQIEEGHAIIATVVGAVIGGIIATIVWAVW